MEIKIEMNLASLQKRLQPEEFRKRLLQEMKVAMEESTLIAAGEVSRLTPVGVTGNLAKISHRVSNLLDGVEGLVFSHAKYAIFVEEGTKAPRRMPPPGPIGNWVRYRLGVSDPRRLRQVTWLVQRRIATAGTRAVRMFEQGSQASRDRIEASFNQHIQKAL